MIEDDISEETRLRAETASLVSSLFPVQAETFEELLSSSLGTPEMALPKSRLDTALPEIIRELGYQVSVNERKRENIILLHKYRKKTFSNLDFS